MRSDARNAEDARLLGPRRCVNVCDANGDEEGVVTVAHPRVIPRTFGGVSMGVKILTFLDFFFSLLGHGIDLNFET